MPSLRAVLAWIAMGSFTSLLRVAWLAERRQHALCALQARMDRYDRATWDDPRMAPRTPHTSRDRREMGR